MKYFIFRFGGSKADYKDDTKIRKRFSNEAWEGLADTLSNMDLLQQAGIVLQHKDMTDEITYHGEQVSPSTIGHLVYLICTKAKAK